MKNEAKIKELFNNEEFTNKFSAAGSLEEVKNVFSAFGLEITDEDLAEIVKAPMGAKNEELNEEELGDVNGGIVGAAWSALTFTWNACSDYWGGTDKMLVETYKFWRGVFR